MVSSTPSSTQKPALSYADSARKAQGIRPTTSQATQKRQLPNASVPSPVAAVASRADTSIATAPAVGDRPAATAENAPPTQLPLPAESASTSQTLDGGQNHQLSDDTATPPMTSTFKRSVPPTVNVWSARLEKMAQAQAQAKASSQSNKSRTSESSAQTRAEGGRGNGDVDVSDNTKTSLISPDVTDGSRKAPTSEGLLAAPHDNLPGQPSKFTKGDDPWSARQSVTQHTTPVVPHLEDNAEWPEVGKVAPGTSTPARSGGSPEKDPDEKDEGEKREDEHVAPRKSKPRSIVYPDVVMPFLGDSSAVLLVPSQRLWFSIASSFPFYYGLP